MLFCFQGCTANYELFQLRGLHCTYLQQTLLSFWPNVGILFPLEKLSVKQFTGWQVIHFVVYGNQVSGISFSCFWAFSIRYRILHDCMLHTYLVYLEQLLWLGVNGCNFRAGDSYINCPWIPEIGFPLYLMEQIIPRERLETRLSPPPLAQRKIHGCINPGPFKRQAGHWEHWIQGTSHCNQIIVMICIPPTCRQAEGMAELRLHTSMELIHHGHSVYTEGILHISFRKACGF